MTQDALILLQKTNAMKIKASSPNHQGAQIAALKDLFKVFQLRLIFEELVALIVSTFFFSSQVLLLILQHELIDRGWSCSYNYNLLKS